MVVVVVVVLAVVVMVVVLWWWWWGASNILELCYGPTLTWCLVYDRIPCGPGDPRSRCPHSPKSLNRKPGGGGGLWLEHRIYHTYWSMHVTVPNTMTFTPANTFYHNSFRDTEILLSPPGHSPCHVCVLGSRPPADKPPPASSRSP